MPIEIDLDNQKIVFEVNTHEYPLVNCYFSKKELVLATFRIPSVLDPNKYSNEDQWSSQWIFGAIPGAQWICRRYAKPIFDPIGAIRLQWTDLPIWNLATWLFLKLKASISIVLDSLGNGPPLVYDFVWQINTSDIDKEFREFLVNYQLSKDLFNQYTDFLQFWTEIDESKAEEIIQRSQAPLLTHLVKGR